MESQKIKIAIAGRTNVGKTTLIRTLMKATVGEVKDLANVTKKGEAYYFDGLQATFIDTPGFQYAVLLRLYMENPDFPMNSENEKKTRYDQEAIDVLSNSDIVLYVASLKVVPDDSFSDEIYVIKHKCPKIVAIINQYQKQLKATNKEEVNNRIKQWTDWFREQDIYHIVIFDAHWDNPVKIKEIYNNIKEILNDPEKTWFSEGLRAFKKRQYEIREEACSMLANLIKDSLENITVTLSKGDFNNEEKKKAAEEKLGHKIDKALGDFILSVGNLYEVASEHPSMSKEELLVELSKSETNYGVRMGTASLGATILGAAAAAIGAIIVGPFAALIPGGLGLLGGMWLGAQVGGIIGAGLGSLFVFSDDGDTMTMKIDKEQIKTLLVKGIAIIWGLSNTGYGRERELSVDEIQKIEEEIRVQASNKAIDLTSSRKTDIMKYCGGILAWLEDEYE